MSTHYQRLLNVEFPWDETLLSHIEPSIGPAPFITTNMVLSLIQKMKLENHWAFRMSLWKC